MTVHDLGVPIFFGSGVTEWLRVLSTFRHPAANTFIQIPTHRYICSNDCFKKLFLFFRLSANLAPFTWCGYSDTLVDVILIKHNQILQWTLLALIIFGIKTPMGRMWENLWRRWDSTVDKKWLGSCWVINLCANSFSFFWHRHTSFSYVSK